MTQEEKIDEIMNQNIILLQMGEAGRYAENEAYERSVKLERMCVELVSKISELTQQVNLLKMRR